MKRGLCLKKYISNRVDKYTVTKKHVRIFSIVGHKKLIDSKKTTVSKKLENDF